MIPLELWLRALTRDEGCACLWYCPDLVCALEALPECGTVFIIEHTTAAKGPYVLWYPASAYQAELERQANIDKLIAKQYAAVERAKERRKQDLIAQIGRAKRAGNLDAIYELRKELSKL